MDHFRRTDSVASRAKTLIHNLVDTQQGNVLPISPQSSFASTLSHFGLEYSPDDEQPQYPTPERPRIGSGNWWSDIFQEQSRIRFNPCKRIPPPVIHLIMKLLMDHEFYVDKTHHVTWIAREEDHPAWHASISEPLLHTLAEHYPAWYLIVQKAIDSHMDIAIPLLNAMNLPSGYYEVTYRGLFQIVTHDGPEYV